MDPLSLTGTLIAVLQITTSVISICYDYRQGIASASRDAAQITDELNSLRDVLEALLKLVEKSSTPSNLNQTQNETGNETGNGYGYGDGEGRELELQTMKILGGPNGPLQNAEKELLRLKQKLEPEKGWRKLRGSLVWPLKRTEVEGAMGALERVKGTLGLALSADQMTLSLVIKDDVNDLSKMFQRFGNDQKHQEIYKWLAAPDPYANHVVNRKKRQPKTGMWIFRMKQYEHWLQGTNSVLWIYGIPGSGKTILCSTIIEQLIRCTQEIPRIALAYFYFDTTKRDVNSLLRSLITQLSSQHTSIPLPLLQLYTTHQTGLKNKTLDDEDLLSTLQSLILAFNAVYIIFDAIDESVNCEEVRELINNLHAWDLARLHLLVTSRPLLEIEEGLGEIVSERICLQDAEGNQDILLYIGEMLENDKVLGKWPEDLKRLVKIKLLSGEEGMFQWVFCQLDILRKCTSISSIRKTLKAGLPRNLDQTYDQILLGIDEMNRPDVVKVLMVLTVSSVPLTLEKIVEILAVDLEACPPRFEKDARLLEPKTILSMCSSLVTTSTMSKWAPFGYNESQPTLRLAHASVADYLTHHPEFHFTFSSASQFLGQAFLAYLLNPAFSSGPCTSRSQLQKLKLSYPLLKNCAHFWPQYFADPAGVLQEKSISLILSLFETRNLGNGGNYAFWISLLIPNCSPSIIKNTHPLYYSASFGLTSVVRTILSKEGKTAGFDINQKGGRPNASALHVAVYRNHIEVARLLLENGADPDSKNDAGEAPLHWANAKRNREMVNLLCGFGAKALGGGAEGC